MPGAWLSQVVRRLRREPPADGCSDADLLARFARDRDEAAFELLVWRHGGMVLSACRRLLGHHHDAEDAFQATFLVLARKAGGVGRGAALPAWLHRVAVRISTRAAKRRRGAAPLVGEVAAPAVPDPVAGAEVAALLDAEIDRLPDRLRRAVVLCYLEGLTAAEAGVRLGCPTGTVESRLAAARRALRVRLARRGVTPPVGVFAFVGAEAVLAPEAVAALARAGREFVTGGPVAEVGDGPVRLAKGELAMGVKRLAAGVGAVGLAVAVSAGIGWADKPTPKPDEPAARAEPAPPPKAAEAKAAEPAKSEAWPFARAFTIHNGRVVGVAPDGRIVSVMHENQVVIGGDGLLRQDVIASENAVRGAAVSPDGKLVATAEGVQGVKLWDAATGKLLAALWPSGGLPAYQVAFTPDGVRVAAVCWMYDDPLRGGPRFDGGGGFQQRVDPKVAARKPTQASQVAVWAVATGQEVGQPAAKVEVPRGAAPEWRLSADGRFALRSESVLPEPRGDDSDGTPAGRQLIVVDTLTGKAGPPIRLDGLDWSPARPLPLGPDGKTVAVVNRAGTEVRLHNLDDRPAVKLTGFRRPVYAVAFSPDGRRVATASGWGGQQAHADAGVVAPSEIIIWDTATGREVERLADRDTIRDYATVRFGPGGRFLVAQEQSGRVSLWGTPPVPPPAPVVAPADTTPDRFAGLLKELSADGVTDARRVEAVFLAALGRLPTDTEAKALAAQLGRQADKPAAVRDLLDTLVGTAEFKAHAAALGKLAK